MPKSEAKEWWGAAEAESDDASWKTGSEAKRLRMARYVEWLLTPAAERQPPSKAKLAESMGVTPQTLRHYQKDPVFQRQLQKDARALARVDQVPDILQSLYLQAIDQTNPRSVAAGKAFLDYVEKVTPGEDAPLDLENVTDEDLGRLAVELLQKLSG